MRAASALCLLLASGCAAATTRQTEEPLHAQPAAPRGDGTLKPVASTLDGSRIVMAGTTREACQTNDPMPTAALKTTPPQMLNVRPLHVAPMPNYCPVTAPTGVKSVATTTPLPPKLVPAPVPTEPTP